MPLKDLKSSSEKEKKRNKLKLNFLKLLTAQLPNYIVFMVVWIYEK